MYTYILSTENSYRLTEAQIDKFIEDSYIDQNFRVVPDRDTVIGDLWDWIDNNRDDIVKDFVDENNEDEYDEIFRMVKLAIDSGLKDKAARENRRKSLSALENQLRARLKEVEEAQRELGWD